MELIRHTLLALEVGPRLDKIQFKTLVKVVLGIGDREIDHPILAYLAPVESQVCFACTHVFMSALNRKKWLPTVRITSRKSIDFNAEVLNGDFITIPEAIALHNSMHNAINMVLSRAIELVTAPNLVYNPDNWLALASQWKALNTSFRTVEAAILGLSWIDGFEELIERLRDQIREQEALHRHGTPELPPPSPPLPPPSPQVELSDEAALAFEAAEVEFGGFEPGDPELPEVDVPELQGVEADAVEAGLIQMNQPQNRRPRNPRQVNPNAFVTREEFTEGLNNLRTELREEFSREINEVRAEVNELRTEVNQLRTEVNELRTEVSEIRTEFRTEIAALRTEFRNDMNDLRTEFRNDMNALRTELKNDMNDLRTEFRNDMRGMFNDLRRDLGLIPLVV